MSFACRPPAFGGGGAPVLALSNKTGVSFGSSSSITVSSDGVVTVSGNSQADGSQNWFLPTTSAIGNLYWVRLTTVSGSTGMTGDSRGVWHALSTGRSWTLTLPGVGLIRNFVGTLEIASSAGGTPVVSATVASGVNLTADNM